MQTRALSLNLINKKVPKEELLSTALTYAERIASLPADAVMSSRLLMKQANANLLEDETYNVSFQPLVA